MLIYFLARRPPRGLGSRRPRSAFLTALRNLFKTKVRCAPTSPGTPAPEGARALGAVPPLRVGTPTSHGSDSHAFLYWVLSTRVKQGQWRDRLATSSPSTDAATMGNGSCTPRSRADSARFSLEPTRTFRSGGQSPLIGPFRFGALVFVRCFNGVQDS